MQVVVVYGAATPAGRVAAAADVLVERFAARGAAPTLVDLHATTLPFAGTVADDPAVTRVVETIAAARAVAICSPVYRASYPGVLKNLLDHLPVAALRDTPVGLCAVGASDHHYLGVDIQLRPVLAWFGALAAPTSVYLSSGDFAEGRPSDGATAQLDDLAATLLSLTTVTGPLGPAPLAGRAQ